MAMWIAVACSGGAAWAVGVFFAAWAVRAAAARVTDGALGRPGPSPILLLPLRDALSAAQVAVSYFGARVVWRGHVMQADDGRAAPYRPAE